MAFAFHLTESKTKYDNFIIVKEKGCVKLGLTFKQKLKWILL